MAVVDKDNGWNALKKSLRKLGDQEVVAGILGDIDFSLPTVAAIGLVHEFGSPERNIPERSFIRSTFDKNEAKYTRLLQESVRKVVRTKKIDKAALFRLGETARKDIVNRIVQGEIKQGLKPKTIARKGSSTALVDTGALVGSIVSKVRKR
jgi:hypothetical protein